MSHSTEKVVKDLLKNPTFIAWVLEENPELDQYWDDWTNGDYSKKTALNHARFKLLTSKNEIAGITDEHIAYKVSQSLEIAKRREKSFKTKKPSFNLLKRYWLTAASVIFILASALGFYKTYISNSTFTENQKQFQVSSDIIEIENSNNTVKYIQLPDGSSVVLQKNSRISFTKQFDANKRVVVLSGEAFFEVTKDADRPFFVYANELVTKVLGTSFSVSANENGKNVFVAVKTGKVSVFSNNDKHVSDYKSGKKLSALLLMPNQQATFERDKFTVAKINIKRTALLKIPIESQSFNYKETPVSEVFSSLEKAYGVRIEYNDKVMADCSITATLGDEPLDNKLKWICAILEADYQINGDKVNIKGNSCN
ncbi:FecR family protein [Dyadobacter sp. CY345]|uniref:FecR family protein n=1 Tax=Dyadobacter sp. CY345 TaxID=2909335 RepID=UPI001F1FA24A|nr:FecR family protein [Dyadobacter sp. CY345]MCF2444727.1 FecR family protein [Dyadobacter sp. CY345]